MSTELAYVRDTYYNSGLAGGSEMQIFQVGRGVEISLCKMHIQLMYVTYHALALLLFGKIFNVWCGKILVQISSHREFCSSVIPS